jgi:transcription factor TFIIIB component B''
VPKAPPRRATRNATTPSAGSRGEDAASQSQSVPSTPDPPITQDTLDSSTFTQQGSIQNEHGPASGARTAGGSRSTTTLDSSARQTTASIQNPASLRAVRAPTVISTVPELAAPSPSKELQNYVGASDGIAATAEPIQTLTQTRTGTRSSRKTSKTDTSVGTVSDSNDEGASTTDITSKAPKKRRKRAYEVPPAPPTAEADGGASIRTLEQVEAGTTEAQVSLKKKARSRRQIVSADHDGEFVQPPAQEDQGSQPTSPTPIRRKSTRKRKQRLSAQEAADEVIAEATAGSDGNREEATGKRRKRKRKLGSEEAANHEIVPAEVKMADLVKDKGLGKISRREVEMRKIDWADVKRKRREAEEEAQREDQKQKEARKNGRPLPPPGPHVAERLVLVNGQIVIDESSRVIDRNAETARDADQAEEAIDEDSLTKRVNQATVGRKPGKVRTYSTWDDEETEQFYQGLRMFGTDFMMISKMFPGTSRIIIKKKYNKEEKLHPAKVLAALNSKQPVDLEIYSKITDTVYDDPQDFYKELEEAQVRIEAEDAKMRAEEAQEAEEAEQEIQESIEQDEAEASEGAHPGSEARVRKNRFAAEAQSIVDAANSRKKGSKQTPAAKKKGGKKGKGRPAEGTEEMVGRIEDIDP